MDINQLKTFCDCSECLQRELFYCLSVEKLNKK